VLDISFDFHFTFSFCNANKTCALVYKVLESIDQDIVRLVARFRKYYKR